MVAAEAAIEAATIERTIDVVVGIVTAGIMSHPSAVVLNVGNFPMFSPPLFPARLNSGGSRTTFRNVPAAKTMTTTAMLAAASALPKTRDNKHQTYCKKTDSVFHATPPITNPHARCRKPGQRSHSPVGPVGKNLIGFGWTCAS